MFLSVEVKFLLYVVGISHPYFFTSKVRLSAARPNLPRLQRAEADAHDDQLIRRPRLFPRFFRPRPPVDRVVGVLQEVGAGLLDEGVGVRM